MSLLLLPLFAERVILRHSLSRLDAGFGTAFERRGIHVALEDAATIHKMKFLAEDVGLLYL